MKLGPGHIAAVVAPAVLGWALCGAVMFAGMWLFSLKTAIVVHAFAAPVIFASISWFSFDRLGHTSPLTTAASFTATVIFMDFFLVALVINRSLDMFRSVLGTWIPFTLILLSTYLTGLAVKTRARNPKPV